MNEKENPSRSLEFTTPNIDSRSGFLYQVDGFRKELIELMQKEFILGKPKLMVFIDIDLDGLKRFNTLMGHDGGDQAIEFFADHLKNTMGELSKKQANFHTIYKLHPGGDEFKIIMVVEEDSQELINELIKNISTPITREFTYSEPGKENLEMITRDYSLTASAASASAPLSNKKEELFESFQRIEEKSKQKLSVTKDEKADDIARMIIREGKGKTIGDYIELIAKELGDRRIAPNFLLVLLEQMRAKKIQEESSLRDREFSNY